MGLNDGAQRGTNYLALHSPDVYSRIKMRLKSDYLRWLSSPFLVSWLAPIWYVNVWVGLKTMTCFFQSFVSSLSAFSQPVEIPFCFPFQFPFLWLYKWTQGLLVTRRHVWASGSCSLVYLLMLIATMTGCHPDFRTSAREGLCLAIATQSGIMTMKTAQIRGERYFTSGKEKKSWFKCPWLPRLPKLYCIKSGRKAAGIWLRLRYINRKIIWTKIFPTWPPHSTTEIHN